MGQSTSGDGIIGEETVAEEALDSAEHSPRRGRWTPCGSRSGDSRSRLSERSADSQSRGQRLFSFLGDDTRRSFGATTSNGSVKSFCLTPCSGSKMPGEPQRVSASDDVPVPDGQSAQAIEYASMTINGATTQSISRPSMVYDDRSRDSTPNVQPAGRHTDITDETLDPTPARSADATPAGGSSTVRSALRRNRARAPHRRVSFDTTDPHLLEVDATTEQTLLRTAMKGLRDMAPELLQKPKFRVSFRDQLGLDEGGLRRDFFARLGLILQKPHNGLLMPAEGGCLQLCPSLPEMATCNLPDVPAWWWESLGRLLAAAVLHEEPLGLNIAPSVCKQLVGLAPSFEDLEALRPADFRALRSLRRQQVTASHVDEPGLLVLQTSGTHGASPGETVYIKAGSELAGEYVVQHAVGLNELQLAIPWGEDSLSTPPEPGILCRYRSDEDAVNETLEVLGCTVPSRVAMVREALNADDNLCEGQLRSGVFHSEDFKLTTANFEEFIMEAADKLMRRNLEPNLTVLQNSFRQGLGDHAKHWTAERWQELHKLLCGEMEIDLESWRAAAITEGYEPELEASTVDQWFTALTKLSAETRRRVLSWCTGWAALPSGGWPRDISFVLRNSGQGPEFLPQAHTCAFTVDLPCYANCEQLEVKLMLAIQEQDFSFR
eukprot:TRINITY_DN93848_c0_g1_i1.p1 TRINITY_DN93848_c0_g1~~TRINITY_DN93848_c0_g1_i1.p1  ORF type:complete len:663 (-),score=90.22 TRINITY_DN93848_c0_g1_i1:12-2000(-)